MHCWWVKFNVLNIYLNKKKNMLNCRNEIIKKELKSEIITVNLTIGKSGKIKHKIYWNKTENKPEKIRIYSSWYFKITKIFWTKKYNKIHYRDCDVFKRNEMKTNKDKNRCYWSEDWILMV